MEKAIRRILKDLDENEPLESLAIWKPFSFVLVDDDRETVAELMLFDEDNTLLSQSLMQGLDEEGQFPQEPVGRVILHTEFLLAS